jgi:HD-GYP domain-containing protein (c-di-GMP phosphodiesterase class II)
VYIDPNNILVGPRVPVKQKDVERLLSWGILELETAGELLESVDDETKTVAPEVQQKRDALLSTVSENLKAAPAEKGGPVEIDYQIPEREGVPLDEEIEPRFLEWVLLVKEQFENAKNGRKLDRPRLEKTARDINQLVRDQKSDLISFARAFETPEYMSLHNITVAIYAAIIGQSLEFPEDKLLRLLLGSLLLDIGMVRVPDHILRKDSRLTVEEFKKVQTHPLFGYRILVQENGLPHEAGLVALEHHEQCDGNGYPRRLSAEQISEFGKIGAVVDAYDAMTQKRSYRDEYLSHEAMKNILSVGQQRFDQTILRTFLRQMGVYPIGSYVKLNNNCVGIVAEADPELPMRPTVRIIRDEFGDQVMEEEMMRLAVEKDIFIVRALEDSAANEPRNQS